MSLVHWIIVGVLLLIFFGPNKLPQFGQSLGKAIRGFKQGLNEIDADSKDVTPNQQISQNNQQQPMNTQSEVKNNQNS